MFSYKVSNIASRLMVLSVSWLIGEFLLKRFGSYRDKKILRVVRGILLLLSFVLFIWLLFHKELFHWNFDIATGEPVDHYSTYGRCMVYSVIAIVSNVIGGIVRLTNHRKKEAKPDL